MIHAPASIAWRLLTDTQAWSRWGPSVQTVDCPTRIIGPGTAGRVRTTLGLWIPFRITDDDWEEGCYWHWTVGGIAATGHRVTGTGPSSCVVTFTVPTWAPFYLPVCKAALHRLDQLAAVSGA